MKLGIISSVRRARTTTTAALLTAAVMLATLAATDSAAAHQQTFPTAVTVPIEHVPSSGTGISLFGGRVTSSRAACVRGRRIKAIAVYGDGSRRVVDRALTSASGGFGLRFDVTGVDFGILNVARKRLGPKGKRHRHVCRPAMTAGSGGGM